MRNAILSALALTALITGTATRAQSATVEGSAVTSSAALIEKAVAVCDGPFVLTAAAMAACTAKQWPVIIGDGSQFRNAGLGAEFNTLIRQLPTVAASN